MSNDYPLRIGKVFIYKPLKKPRKKQQPSMLVYITSGQYFSGGRISNAWSGRVINKDGSLGEEISLLYLPSSCFQLAPDVEIAVTGKGLENFFQ